jgi:ATP-dependent helicase/nuclease subunit A
MIQPTPNAAQQNISCVWVGASAGTGKTKTLTDRVLSLLLNGVPADKILCLTFTKAAATEMYLRIIARLKNWTGLEEDKLTQEIIALGVQPNFDRLQMAKSLFLTLLDLEGGLKIMTLHSFCQNLLKRFPLEAGISPSFSVLDNIEARELLDSAIDEAYSRNLNGESKFKTALFTLNRLYGDGRIRDLLNAFLRERFKVHQSLMQDTTLYDLFHIDKNLTEKQLMQDFMSDKCIPIHNSIEALKHGSASDQSRAAIMAEWSRLDQFNSELYKTYRSCFLTQKGEIRKRLFTKKAADFYPPIESEMLDEALRINSFEENIECFKAARLTENLMALGHEIFNLYENLKNHRGVLDYEDLIIKSCTLLEKKEQAAWIHYKLDGGIDHILVDEAQDTNPEQWRIITSMMHDFFDGESANQRHRGLFVVGDRKQSIYRFQRADPELFNEHRDFFAQQIQTLGNEITEHELDISYRSAPAILQAVDAVFASYNAPHKPHRIKARGIVELYPPLHAQDKDEELVWELPVKQKYQKSLARRMADQIANQIKNWLQHKEILESKGRPIEASDIMILVRKRGRFMHDMVRALKAQNIPVAGVDRMLLNEQLVIKDLLALGEAMLFPEDDLTLACVLKGPFIGAVEEQLYDYAAGRSGSLWQALELKNPDLYALMTNWRKQALILRPFEFYTFILRKCNGRSKALARLSIEAETAIDGFLDQLITYEKKHTPSLQHFLRWFQSRPIEIKRDLDTAQNEVRIMTIHGAKGLQAPIVFLPDTMQRPHRQPLLLWHDALPIINKIIPNDHIKELQENEKILQQEEYLRLLYVAMTRAEDRLYIHGWSEKKNDDETVWYNQIYAALSPITEKIAVNSGVILRLEDKNFQPIIVAQHNQPKHEKYPLPQWAHKSFAPSNTRVASIETNNIFSDDLSPSTRGEIIHKLLEWLPNIEDEKRLNFIKDYLNKHVDSQYHHDFLNTFKNFLQSEVAHTVLDRKGLSEVTLAGKIDGVEIVARIDRLIFEQDRILIIDYKTGEDPQNQKYSTQLRLYKKLVEQLYPLQKIECCLLWIDLLKFEKII